MFSWVDSWPVLVRQILLIAVPVCVAKGWLPGYLADPVVEFTTYVIGTLLVGWIVWLGQRREKPDVKIAEAEALKRGAE